MNRIGVKRFGFKMDLHLELVLDCIFLFPEAEAASQGVLVGTQSAVGWEFFQVLGVTSSEHNFIGLEAISKFFNGLVNPFLPLLFTFFDQGRVAYMLLKGAAAEGEVSAFQR